jgi:hypothetical protein
MLPWAQHMARDARSRTAAREPILLLRLCDPQAPYKGAWMLEQDSEGLVRASHTTFRHAPCHGCGCVIEHRYFPAHGSARAFVRHLRVHGWSIVQTGANVHALMARWDPS